MRAGAPELAAFLEQLPPAHVTVVGHSYGSAVTAQAVAQTPRAANSGRSVVAQDVVLVGSPGTGFARAAQIGTTVWVGENPNGEIADVARMGVTEYGGVDPSDDSFGAIEFAVPASGASYVPFVGAGHDDYLDPDSASLLNIAYITIGRDGSVVLVGG